MLGRLLFVWFVLSGSVAHAEPAGSDFAPATTSSSTSWTEAEVGDRVSVRVEGAPDRTGTILEQGPDDLRLLCDSGLVLTISRSRVLSIERILPIEPLGPVDRARIQKARTASLLAIGATSLSYLAI